MWTIPTARCRSSTVATPRSRTRSTACPAALPLRTVLKQRWRLPLMLQAPRRSKIDESAYFSDGADLSDNTVALMRQLEGRIKLYRNAIALSEALLDSLRKQTAVLEQRLLAVGEDLAEARHDVAVTRALIAEEEATAGGDQRSPDADPA
jgi:hypothetical protein